MDNSSAFVLGFIVGFAACCAVAVAVSVAREFVDDLRFSVEYDDMVRDMKLAQHEKNEDQETP